MKFVGRCLVGVVISLGLFAAACSSEGSGANGDASPGDDTLSTTSEAAAESGANGDASPSDDTLSTTSEAAAESGANGDASPSDDGNVNQSDSEDPVEGSNTNLEEYSYDDLEMVKIGFAYPDVSAFAILNKKFSIGDPEEQATAVLDGWRREGLLPLNGRDIELVFRNFPILNTSQKLGVCTSFSQDDEVFAVVSGRDFTAGAECLATRYAIPVIDLNAAPPSTYVRGAPWFFTLRSNESEVMWNLVQWAQNRGEFEDSKIGLFWDTRSEEAADAFKEALAEFGHEVVVDIPSDGEGVGSPQDQISVERFAAEGVNIAVLLVGTSSVTNFMAFSERQDYHPKYLAFEWAGQIGDVASASLPQEQFDGAIAMALSRVGEIAAGNPLSVQADACLDNYVRFSGNDIERTSPETAEFVQILYTCDLMSVLYAGLVRAGEELTKEKFVSGLEGLEGFPLASWGDLTFGSGDHSGVQQFRTIEWSTDCLCWTAVSQMSDFVVR